ncbi:hypothetical protein C6501_06070 [Candidatus Poribacteria bacterium]|nr:MAG: hypothetical protein C6501_06070 [Candidatus Poribacteria bacterium]
MKNFLTKVGYMVLGCLLTLIGYHFGNIDNNSADAQLVDKEKAPIVDEIWCRKLIIVGEDDTPRIKLGIDAFDRGEIEVYNEEGANRISLGIASDIDTGFIEIEAEDSGGIGVMLGTDSNGGFMALFNKVLDKPVLQVGITNNGGGFVVTFDKTGVHTSNIGPKGRTGVIGKSR